jgi:hypothetical protein
VRDLPNLPKCERMFQWFPHLVNHLLPCAVMFFFFMLFGGICGSIFDLMI